jgi:hypothetical protein
MSDTLAVAMSAAKQGNPSAIAQFLTHHLRTRSMKVKAASAADCLNLLVEGETLPDQQWVVAQIIHEVKALGVESIAIVQVYGKAFSDAKPQWSHRFELAQEVPPELEPEPIVIDPITLAKEGDLAEIRKFIAEVLSDRPDLTTVVELEGTCLKVIVQTSEFLDGQNFAADFGKKLSPIASDQIQEVAIYKRRSEGTNGFLVKQMHLARAE